jgi:Fe-S cluster biogenesis protein NfuA
MTTVTPEQIESVLDEKVRPYLNVHGGDIRLLEITSEGIARFKLTGACATCPGASQTMTEVVEVTLKKCFPSLKGIEAVYGVSDELLQEARIILRRSRNEKNSG